VLQIHHNGSTVPRFASCPLRMHQSCSESMPAPNSRQKVLRIHPIHSGSIDPAPNTSCPAPNTSCPVPNPRLLRMHDEKILRIHHNCCCSISPAPKCIISAQETLSPSSFPLRLHPPCSESTPPPCRSTSAAPSNFVYLRRLVFILVKGFVPGMLS
jgi:hypothetical protein